MIRWVSFPVALCVALAAATAFAEPVEGKTAAEDDGQATKIKELRVEDTNKAALIRIALAGAAADGNPKLICAGDAIRIRLPGIAARQAGIEEIEVPPRGPWSKARIVPRRGSGSVLQLFASGSNVRACERTSALAVGGEIIISTSLSPADLARRAAAEKAAQAPAGVEANKESGKESAEPATDDKEQGAVAAESAAEAAPVASGKQLQSGAMSLFAKNSTSGEAPAQPAAAEENDNTLRYLAGLGMAILLAGVAWYYKRRQGKGLGKNHAIDILSSRRLGAKHQLLLVEVEGTKLLLAVADKNVTTLSTIQGADNAAAASALPDLAALAAHAQAPPIVEAPAPTMPAEPRFRAELSQALSAAPTQYAPQSANSSQTNVEGLLAMARNRAVIERAARQIPEAEA